MIVMAMLMAFVPSGSAKTHRPTGRQAARRHWSRVFRDVSKDEESRDIYTDELSLDPEREASILTDDDDKASFDRPIPCR